MVLPVNTAVTIADIVAALRPLHDDLALPDTCVIRRRSTEADSRGGRIQTWEDSDPIRCSLDTSGISGREIIVGSTEVVDRPYTITLPFGTAVVEQDQVVVDDRVFEIENVKAGGGFEVAVTLQCREVVS